MFLQWSRNKEGQLIWILSERELTLISNCLAPDGYHDEAKTPPHTEEDNEVIDKAWRIAKRLLQEGPRSAPQAALETPQASADDVRIECKDCANEFTFTAREAAYYESKGFTPPKRCKPCREEKKARQQEQGR